jgi:hypothetical protein
MRFIRQGCHRGASIESCSSPTAQNNERAIVCWLEGAQLVEQISPDYILAIPTINLNADELAAVAAAIRRTVEDDKFPHAPRLGKLDAALEPTPLPKAPPPAKVDKRVRR